MVGVRVYKRGCTGNRELSGARVLRPAKKLKTQFVAVTCKVLTVATCMEPRIPTSGDVIWFALSFQDY
jgi:hypothetical protein